MNIREQSLLHAARCAAAATTPANRNYWLRILDSSLKMYDGDKIRLDKSDPLKWKIKIAPDWLENLNAEPINVTGDEVRDLEREVAQREVAHSAHLYHVALMRRLREHS